MAYGTPLHYDRRMQKTTIYLTDELRDALRRHVRRTGMRQSDVVREALGAYLATEDPGLPSSVGSADGPAGLDAANYEDEFARAMDAKYPDVGRHGPGDGEVDVRDTQA
jgi:Arc/MetJ-type ribon-helix-helix transcriptional regulator